MNKKILVAALSGTILTVSSAANATLEPRLDGKAYYDTETDLTWTANANPNGIKPWSEQRDFANNYVLDGVNGWRMPTEHEIRVLFEYVTTCDMVNFFCLNKPDQPLRAIDYLFNNEHEKNGALYRFESIDYILIEGTPNASLWPVHDGDVAIDAVPIPEPSTYPMLLAGLGLLGFMARRRKESSV